MPDSNEILSRLRLLHPSLIDLSLTRVTRLLEALGNPHLNLPKVLHIAGTNGKGSTLAFLRAMLEAAGYKVHCFVSPHLQQFNERIQLASDNGCKPVSENILIDILQRTEQANKKNDITFFEITTCAAFLAFSEHEADFLLLETGLGGRLDATNVVPDPLASIITPISMDHMAFLGNDITSIAKEKAGIIKRDRPVIISHQKAEVLNVFEEYCQAMNTTLFAGGKDWDSYEQHGRLVFQTENLLTDLPSPALQGRHQFMNAGTAIAALHYLRENIKIKEKHLAAGLQMVQWPGRLERLDNRGALAQYHHFNSEIWVDGGHNPAAGQILTQMMADLEEKSSKPLHIIVGMLKRKDFSGFIEHFRGLAQKIICVPVPATDNGFAPEELAKICEELEIEAIIAQSVQNALQKSFQLSPKPCRILICGSLYLAGEALSLHDVDLQT